MQPLDRDGHVRITIEATDPQLAQRTAYTIAILTGGSGPSEPQPTADGTYSVWIYARPEE
ncbi:hypothetical protein [Streptomyces axinellae]|uniref:Cadherin-like beta sandwich domain-containing protein n=1 Tax=Streptomyces axinellae TaxID=552788 RepID=A0ABP6D1D5_9ACTN